MNFPKKKWPLNCSYNPKSSYIESHLEYLSKSIDVQSSKYENIILLGDLNSCILDISVKEFCKTYKFLSLIEEATCFKHSENPPCIDLVLTNKHFSFQQSGAIETGLSDFRKMVLTMMKMHFPIITLPLSLPKI